MFTASLLDSLGQSLWPRMEHDRLFRGTGSHSRQPARAAANLHFRLPRLAVLVSSPVVAPSSAPLAAAHVRTANSPGNHQHTIGTMVAPQSVFRTIESGNGMAIPFAPDLRGVGVSDASNARVSGNGVGMVLALDST